MLDATPTDTGAIPEGYKKPVKISNRTKMIGLLLTMRHPQSADIIQKLFEEAFLDGVDYAVSEINARHNTQYSLE